MKKEYFTTFLLSLLAFSLSAQPIQVDTSSNWQQWISGILGGNCVQISNVQFTNQAGSAARFTGGSDIGLSQGIVLSTGAVGPQITAVADLFLNEAYIDFNIDTLLEQYATQEIGYTGNPTSYDATRIEFDFVAPSNQQINIRFVFASEEYPEFAPPNNSFFNDIFGFFVAEQGISGYQNIAKVPGTELPVTIGNINAVTNSQFYNESTNGLQFAYDGFTTPISATFNAIGGVAYHMVIAISDIGDPNFDSSVFLELNSNASQSVHGTAYVNATPLEASQVKLWGYNTDPAAFDSIAVALTDINGDYTFSSVDQGLYLIQVVPDAVAYPQAIPIYFPGVVLWEDATAVGVTCDSLDLDGPGMIFNTGPGQITGLIGQDPFGGRLRSNDLIPYEGVNVFLQDSASGEWRGYDISNNWGAYQFNNLALGTYYVYPDVPGIPISEPRKVVISAENPTFNGIDFQMNGSGVLNIDNTNELVLIEKGDNVQWQVNISNYFFWGENVIFKTGIDTLINDTLYTLIKADGITDSLDTYNESEAITVAGFRQYQSKLYMRILVDAPSSFGIAEPNTDLLYFDADLQIGDTLESQFYHTWFNDENVRLRITAIDTILIGNEYRVVWTTEDLNSMVEVDVFTSGIGNSSGLFNLGFPPMLDSYTTYNTCYTDPNGQNLRFHEMYGPLYENYIFNSCFQGTFGGTETILKNSLSVFPNPGNDFLRLETDLNLSGTIYMYDISGRMVNSQPVSNSNNIVNTAQLESGVYILMFVDQAGNRSTGKWIKD
jgi:hypothetical protein